LWPNSRNSRLISHSLFWSSFYSLCTSKDTPRRSRSHIGKPIREMLTISNCSEKVLRGTTLYHRRNHYEHARPVHFSVPW
jgi:hypothetical protein